MSEPCMVIGCDRRRFNDGALCAPHAREAEREDEEDATDYVEGREGENVTTLEAYRAQQAEPEPNGTEPVRFACPEAGCDFSSTRPQGLSRHRNQTHGGSGVAATTKPKATRNIASEPATLEITLDLTAEESDLLDAIAFLNDTTREAILATIVVRFLNEQPPEVKKLARMRADIRANARK